MLGCVWRVASYLFSFCARSVLGVLCCAVCALTSFSLGGVAAAGCARLCARLCAWWRVPLFLSVSLGGAWVHPSFRSVHAVLCCAGGGARCWALAFFRIVYRIVYRISIVSLIASLIY